MLRALVTIAMDASARTVALYQHNEALRKHVTKVIKTQKISEYYLRTMSAELSPAELAANENAFRPLKNHPDFKQSPEEMDGHVVITAETVFYAQGGGQPYDLGVMKALDSDNAAVFDVLAVSNGPHGQILHFGRFQPESTKIFGEGESVEQAIDGKALFGIYPGFNPGKKSQAMAFYFCFAFKKYANSGICAGARRDLNSRIHTGGHIVGLAVRHLAQSIPGIVELKAQHYPDAAFVEFKGVIDGKHKAAIEDQANRFVQRALPVKVYWWNKQEMEEKCAVVPENVVVIDGELLRAVDIEGAGAYPCGGTHVPDTSLVGKVVLRNISRRKGISKISYSISEANGEEAPSLSTAVDSRS